MSAISKSLLTSSRFLSNNGSPIVKVPDFLNGDTRYFDLKGRSTELESEVENLEVEEIEHLFSQTPNKLDVIAEISSYVKKYIYLINDSEYILVSLTCLLSYCVDMFDRVPYLWLRGEKGSGKTTLMAVMKSIVSAPFLVSETSASALFRLVDQMRPTLFLDESENLTKRLNSNQPICQILNSGYQKDGAVSRTKGKAVVSYKTYCLKVLAGINTLFPTLADRCILLELNQTPVGNTLQYYGGDDLEITQPLVELIHSGLKSKLPELQKYIADPLLLDIDSKIRLREFDKWFPILSIAKLFSNKKNNYFKLVQSYALEQIDKKIEAESISPENMCKGILKDFLEYKASRAINFNDPKFLFFRAEEVQNIIKANDPYNFYRDKAAITLVLKGIGVETERKRLNGPPVSFYKIPKSFIN